MDLFDVFETDEKHDEVSSQNLPTVIDVQQQEQKDKRKNVRHSIVFPPSIVPPKDLTDDIYQLAPPKVHARKYPFELDPFQQKSIAALHRGESILVSAHTSAGKTVIAEYAISLCIERNQKIIYTSPIKALSNQKYRDLYLTYTNNPDLVGDKKVKIGLMTGDSTVNRNAQILVMTTEILRNMLHQGAELLREIGCVVFDEVHYMRNSERGLVWEDCISLLSSKINFVFLSATIPNAPEFAAWVCQVHQKPIHVVYTEYRPVPLQFCVCPVGGTEVFPIFTSDNKIVNSTELNRARAALPMQKTKSDNGDGPQIKGNQGKQMIKETVVQILRLLMQRQVYPVIVFSFGKQKCEDFASLLLKSSGFDKLLTKPQQESVEQIFNAALFELAVEDRSIRQIVKAKELLKKGIAVHHSGLLPFVKEITEILFQENLIKVIFVTETFAMGLNLPARCVIFSELQKFDGENSRYIQSGEFIQMAGRSGRRGIDNQGLVITLFQDNMQCQKAIEIMQGGAEPLNSAYRLNFGGIINLLNVQGIDPEYAIRKSFLQFQKEFRLPRCYKMLEKMKIAWDIFIEQSNDQLKSLGYENVETDLLLQYLDLEAFLHQEKRVLQQQLMTQETTALIVQKLIRGKLVEIETDQYFGWGVVVQLQTINNQYLVDVLIPGILPPELKPEKMRGEPYETYAQVLSNSTQKVSDDFVNTLMGDQQYSSFASKVYGQESGDNIDNILFNQTEDHLKISEEQLMQAMFRGNQYAISKIKQQQGKLASNDIMQHVYLKAVENKILKHQNLSSQTIQANLAVKEPIQPVVIRVQIGNISSISSLYLQNLPNQLNSYEDRKIIINKLLLSVYKLAEKNQAFENNCFNRRVVVPLLNFADIESLDPLIVAQQKRVMNIQNLIYQNPQYTNINRIFFDFKNYISIEAIMEKVLLLRKIKSTRISLQEKLKDQSMVLSQELDSMKKFLKIDDYIQENGQVLERGIIAGKINSGNEIIVTECIFNNVFSNLDPALLAAVCSSFIADGLMQDKGIAISQELDVVLDLVQEIAQKQIDIADQSNTELQQYCKTVDDLIDRGTAQLTYKWAQGFSLTDLGQMVKDLFEGNLVRVFKRLITLLEQISEATAGWSGGSLSRLALEACKLVNRGIIKADSLYIAEEQQEE